MAVLGKIFGILELFRRELIRKSTRDEFELARNERDPVYVMKMILTSREAMAKISDKVIHHKNPSNSI
jgi:hypothetical protein